MRHPEIQDAAPRRSNTAAFCARRRCALRVRVLALVSSLIAFGLPGVATAQSIPPGQEELISRMLGKGAALPDGCKFAGGGIHPAAIRVDYECPGTELVTLELIHPRGGAGSAMRTERFEISVVRGSPRSALLDAVESLVRDHESDFSWGFERSGSEQRIWFATILAVLALLSIVEATRTFAPTRESLYAWLGPMAVAVAWFLAFQDRAVPPAHGDTAVDLALARDCVMSGGAICVGHAASALGLKQGQGLTYAIALWMYVGLPIAKLGLLLAAVHGVAAGILHHAIATRFGCSAWLVSAFAPALALYITGFPIIWNPSWLDLPLAVAFVATLAIARGSHSMGPVVAGAALAITAESHLLFGTFVFVACMIALVIADRPLRSAALLACAFYSMMVVVSPLSFSLDLATLRAWLGDHPMLAALGMLMLAASLPAAIAIRRRFVGAEIGNRELAATVLWLAAGLGIGFILPLIVSRPLEIRYFGTAWPALGFAAGWILFLAIRPIRSGIVEAVAVAVFACATMFWSGVDSLAFPSAWSLEEGVALSSVPELQGMSALDIQYAVRSLPHGSMGEVAALAGSADPPQFPRTQLRVVREAEQRAPAGWTRTAVESGAFFFSPIDSWTHPEIAVVCAEPAGGVENPCLELSLEDWREVIGDVSGETHRLLGLYLPRLIAETRRWSANGARSLVWRIPVDAGGSDRERLVFFTRFFGEEIEGVAGAEWTRHSPEAVWITRPPGNGTAAVVVRTSLEGRFDQPLPPMPLELRPGEEGVLAPFASAAPRHGAAPPP